MTQPTYNEWGKYDEDRDYDEEEWWWQDLSKYEQQALAESFLEDDNTIPTDEEMRQ